MRLVVRQMSGLGNQLFQYAAALYYGQRHKAEAEIVMQPPAEAFSNGYPRPCLLPMFQTSIPMLAYGGFTRFVMNERDVFQWFFRPFRSLVHVQMYHEPETERYAFVRALPLGDGVETVYLSGYWQSWEMVQAVEDRLRRDLRLREPAQGRNAEVMAQIAGAARPISLHMRRGDYTLAIEGHLALPLEYYRSAIEHMRAKFVDAEYFVFSDDIEFAREHLPPDLKATFVDHNDSQHAHEDLRLMSACHHHIIANSSFSWWGAWLNGRADKVVVAPRNWLNRAGTYFPGLLPPSWTVID